MIDFEDVEIVALTGNGGGGPVGAFLFLVLVIALFCVAMCNSDECSKKHCDHGVPRLQNHACQCVEEAH